MEKETYWSRFADDTAYLETLKVQDIDLINFEIR